MFIVCSQQLRQMNMTKRFEHILMTSCSWLGAELDTKDLTVSSQTEIIKSKPRRLNSYPSRFAVNFFSLFENQRIK